ncbi:MAG: CDP-glycerol glycerophosphotransferase family protein, partial [Coriobacteriia bacterium]|nr:CDP-glycerol glycerophosphotransferase family protein [Coriobacteriia bacterium]
LDEPDRRTAREIRLRARMFSSVTASSDIDRLAMSASMRLPLGDVWVTGLPRNDWLLVPEHDLPAGAADAISRLRTELDGRRLVLYAPTFRDEGSGIYPFTAEERVELAKTLESHGAVLGVRTHMNESGAAELASENWALDISPTRFPETQAVLRCTDVLVSDYSSIWIDFLLLDQPIIGLIHDLAEYTAGRHLLYDLDHVYGGPLVTDAQGLLGELDDALAGRRLEDHAGYRSAARRIFHRYTDAGATERTVRHILRRPGSRHVD